MKRGTACWLMGIVSLAGQIFTPKESYFIIGFFIFMATSQVVFAIDEKKGKK